MLGPSHLHVVPGYGRRRLGLSLLKCSYTFLTHESCGSAAACLSGSHFYLRRHVDVLCVGCLVFECSLVACHLFRCGPVRIGSSLWKHHMDVVNRIQMIGPSPYIYIYIYWVKARRAVDRCLYRRTSSVDSAMI